MCHYLLESLQPSTLYTANIHVGDIVEIGNDPLSANHTASFQFKTPPIDGVKIAFGGDAGVNKVF